MVNLHAFESTDLIFFLIPEIAYLTSHKSTKSEDGSIVNEAFRFNAGQSDQSR